MATIVMAIAAMAYTLLTMAILTMAIVMQALTSTDDDEISTCLKQLKASAAGTLPSYHP